MGRAPPGGGPKAKLEDLIPLGCSALFIASTYIPFLYTEFYKSGLATQPWHNSTYLLMRLLGIIVMIVYIKIESHYLSGISIKEAALFTLLLVLVNYAKPNFIIAFAPMMFIFLMKDFIRLKGKKTIQIIKFGICVLLSLWILVFQYQILYPDGGDSAIAFNQTGIQELFASPLVVAKIIAGLSFPIVILVLAVWKRYCPLILIQSWVLFLISWMEVIFLTETGSRATHGNFYWGLRMMAYILYLTSNAVLISLRKKTQIPTRLYRIIQTVYICSILSGIWYFKNILTGGSYFI